MQSQDLKKYKLPDKPGVYFFLKGNTILYIGKATSLRDRTRSYFSKDLIATRGPAILDMIVQADKIKYEVTDSVLEALILEAELIKKHLPKYNVKEKDDKSWNYVCITNFTRNAKRGGGEIPKVVVKRGRELQNNFKRLLLKEERSDGKGESSGNFTKFSSVFGPYTNGTQLREALKIIRRIFPYIDESSSKKNNAEFYHQLGLIPLVGKRSLLEEERSDGKGESLRRQALLEYKENIKNLKLFFQGKKKKIIQNLKKDMMSLAKKREFEKAGEIKKKIFALEHINDIALIKEEILQNNLKRSLLEEERSDEKGESLRNYRIEAYDVAHMSGKNMVGVMTVVEDGLVVKSEYKKFIIRTQKGVNDTGALDEILSRRFRHIEWGLPNLVIVDGATAQINVAKRVLSRYQLKIPVVAVIKDERHKPKGIQGDQTLAREHERAILLANSESHRFAISFYRQKSRKDMF